MIIYKKARFEITLKNGISILGHFIIWVAILLSENYQELKLLVFNEDKKQRLGFRLSMSNCHDCSHFNKLNKFKISVHYLKLMIE